jgi:hypothetical protein
MRSSSGATFASIDTMLTRTLSFTMLAGLLGLVGCASDLEGNRDENFSEVVRPDLGGGGGGTSGGGGGSSGTTSSGGGGGMSSGGAPSGAAGFAIATSADEAQGELYDVKSFDINVTGTGGFTGAVTLAVEGTGTNVQYKLDKTTVNPGEKATLRVFSTNGGTSNFTVKGTAAGAPEQIKALKFTASKILTMRMKNGTQAAPNGADNWSSGPADFRTAPMSVFVVTNALPLSVKVVNDDTTGHIVHGVGAFAHGSIPVPVPPNATDPLARTFTTAATLTGYEHILGIGTRNFSIEIKN